MAAHPKQAIDAAHLGVREELIAACTALLGYSERTLQQRVATALGTVADANHIDRVALWSVRGGAQGQARRTTMWTRDGSDPPLKEVATAEIRGLTRPLLAGDPLVIPDVSTIPRSRERDVMDAMGPAACVFLPVGSLAGGRLVLTAGSERTRVWDDLQLEDLQLVGQVLGAVIAREQDAEKLAAQAEHQALIARVSSSLLHASPANFGTLATAAMRDIAEAYSLAMVELVWVLPDGKHWRRTESWSQYGPLEVVDFPGDVVGQRTLAGERSMMKRREFLLDMQPGATGRFTRIDSLSIPCVLDDHLTGAVAFSTTDSTRRFGDDEIQRLTSLAQLLTSTQARVSATAAVMASEERLRAENVYLREESGQLDGLQGIVGDSTPIREMLALIRRVAPTDATVLIHGETGTGKELVARAVHELSPRAQQTMISVNCGALPRDLIESELFGHERGAFSGATSQRKGRFELADASTLFLDEIGELPIDLQPKLLRVLQEGRFERVGGTKTLSVDVRVVAATNRDLAQSVQEGSFRQDLYYRLGVVPVTVPALRERRADLSALAQLFLQRACKRMARSVDAISSEVLDYLQGHNWPGNVRELDAFIQRAVISSDGPVLELPPDLQDSAVHHGQQPGAGEQAGWSPRTLEQMERAHVQGTLDALGWTIEGPSGAAHALGLKPSTLRSRMRKLGIRRAGR